MMKTQLAFLAIGFIASIRGQSVGPDNITTMATATCTTTGTQTYAFIDAASTVYQYMCGGGAGGAVLTNIPSASGIRSWQDCFDWCDNTTVGANGCSGFLYNQGVAYGNGPGQCALRYGSQSFASTISLLSTRVAGLKSRAVVRPAPTFACPAVNSQTIIDNYGQQYLMACGYDTTGSSNTNQGQLVQAANNFNDCFAFCDTYNVTGQGNCTGWQYSGKPDGAGSGNCYLKVVQPAPKFNTVYNQNYVGAIRLAGSSSPSSAMATTTDLGSVPTNSDAAYPSSTSVSSSISSSSSGISPSVCSSTVTVSVTWTPPSRAEL
ncbi:hypothetical protein D6D05_00727 [Aureobasidium pullulans]|nr:hypothetical protein D6D05_00727 [Aureobasidium pullulans]THZ10306.1 hypothetical protein D6C95_00648 [Aureobasidium pullulans]